MLQDTVKPSQCRVWWVAPRDKKGGKSDKSVKKEHTGKHAGGEEVSCCRRVARPNPPRSLY